MLLYLQCKYNINIYVWIIPNKNYTLSEVRLLLSKCYNKLIVKDLIKFAE